MERKEIENKEDVKILVHEFYKRVREHSKLGPIFNTIISDWPAHLDTLVDFWTSNLFLVKAYDGNPMKSHLDIERNSKYEIDQALFGHWLELWFITIDEFYIGEKAHKAKEHARNMAHILFMRIFESRIKGNRKTNSLLRKS